MTSEDVSTRTYVNGTTLAMYRFVVSPVSAVLMRSSLDVQAEVKHASGMTLALVPKTMMVIVEQRDTLTALEAAPPPPLRFVST